MSRKFSTTTTLLLSIIVLATSKKQGGFDIQLSSDESDSKSIETDEYETSKLNPSEFNHRGTLRQSFAVKFFQLREGKNMACSPLSASLPLAKLALGSEGDSKRELLKAIGVSKKSKIQTEVKKLIRMLKGIHGIRLTVASRIFVSDKVKLKKKFVRDAEKVFQSSLKEVDFSHPENAEKIINSWIEQETSQVPGVNINYKVVGRKSAIIINIVTFLGDWQNKFRKVETKPFYSPRGSITVSMMSNQARYKYYKSDALRAQVLEIPYEQNEAVFVIVLPYSRTGLSSLLATLNHSPQFLNYAMRKSFSERVILSMPRFKVFSNGDIIPVYKSLGVNKIFRSNSGLSGIFKDEDVKVDAAWQVTAINVNENGTRAVSATAVELVLVSHHLNQIIFNADHPFLFYIRCANEQIFAGTYSG